MASQDVHWDEVEEAAELLSVGETGEAIELLEALIVSSPDNALAHTYLGNAYFEQERFDEALVRYVRALELAPRFVGAMVGAGQTLRFLGQHDKALRIAREALKVKADDPDALYLAGCVCFQRGEKHAATTYLEKFLETGPEIEVALEVQGMIRVLRGEVGPAIDESEADPHGES
jgi:tetratricopeptide (TPR) repeat protein